jgi:hypothetical protein
MADTEAIISTCRTIATISSDSSAKVWLDYAANELERLNNIIKSKGLDNE